MPALRPIPEIAPAVHLAVRAGQAMADRSTSNPATVHELFEAQARRTPLAAAIVAAAQTLSYAELNARANRLAHLLRERGVRPDDYVGLFFDRSLEMVVAILGVLKAGAAYVPLDPAYPRDRLATMLADTRAALLVTDRTLLAQQPADGVEILVLDALGDDLARQPETDPPPSAGPLHAAYVIYSSGSTGRPKGIVVEHRNVVHSTASRIVYYAGPAQRIALVTSFAFDSSVAAIFWTLATGGAICLPPCGVEQDAACVSRWLQAERVSCWLSVPSQYALLLEQPPQRLASLQTVIVGGEVCPPALAARHHAVLPDAALHNEYGPTEGTVWATVYRCPVDPGDGPLPIGQAIPGTCVYVLDESLRPAAVGAAGELFIGGPGVARGYLGRPDLTTERFLRNPFSDQPGARMYRTGDRVRMRADGQLEFLGRIDRQVKVRGHRIELEEIEAALLRQPTVAEAAVLYRGWDGGHHHLVAYVVPRPAADVSPPRLQRALRETLPEFMVPHYFVLLGRLPVAPGGKVDHRALPLPDRAAVARQCGYAAPADDVERTLAAVWERVFGLAPIGACDDFFDLGGDSLLAAAMLKQVDDELGQSLSLDVLLERPTIRLLADRLRHGDEHWKAAEAVTIAAGDGSAPLFCLPGIGGNVLEFRHLARRLGPRQAMYGLRPAGLGEPSPPHRTIAEMAAYAIRQMRAVQPCGPYRLAGYSLGGIVAFEMALQLGAAGEAISQLALLDSRLWSPPAVLSWTARLKLHLMTLARSSNRGRWHYLRERLRIVAARLRRGDLRHHEDDVIASLDLSEASRKVARVHWQAWRDYTPRVYDGRLTLFVAQQHPAFGDAGTSAFDLGWSRWSTEPVDVRPTNATHAELLRSAELASLGEDYDDRVGFEGNGGLENSRREWSLKAAAAGP